MKFRLKTIYTFTVSTVAAAAFLAAGCANQPNQANANSNGGQTTAVNSQPANANAAPPPAAQPQTGGGGGNQAAASQPVTMPLLDAMFASDEAFAAELKSKLNLTDEQIEKLRQAARESTAGLDETDEGSTTAARSQAEEQIRSIVGAEKANELARFVSERWNGGENAQTAPAQKPNAVPGDTRIVVNAPAYRMDIFKDGQLVRTYKVGIGYPEFPLPTGTRKAGEIIFNPTWTPPDEPWVKGKIKPGQKVAAGSKLNPLGPIKIPIGLPSLIHGGKNPARLGTFASHGCVGLTNPQVQDFALALAQIANTDLSPQDVAGYEKNKTETKNVKLFQPVQVELRYETIVVESGALKIYRDVYERGTNTEENLRRVLEAHGVSLDSLSEEERAKALDALKQMSVDPAGNPIDMVPGANTDANSASNARDKNAGGANKNSNSQSGKVTRNIKGAKEISIPVAALAGKGYPAPVDLNTGGKSNRPLDLTGGNKPQAGASN